MKRFNKILCIVDPENAIDTAAVQAIRLAEEHQAELLFMSVVKVVKPWRSAVSSKEKYLEALADIEQYRRKLVEERILTHDSSMTPKILVVSGLGFIEIIKQVIAQQFDLVVKCAEDTDWIDRMMGSEDMHLLRKCPCPVLMLKPDYNDAFQNVLATVDVNEDFSELDHGRVQEQLNESVLEYTAALSLPKSVEMHIGSVWEAYGEDWLRYGAFSHQPEEKVELFVEQERRDCSTKLEILVRKMDELLGKVMVDYIKPKSHFVKGKASKEIPLMVEQYDIDLVVMGTVGRVGVPGLIIGNTAESILQQCKCSVLAIKPDGFKTPIG